MSFHAYVHINRRLAWGLLIVLVLMLASIAAYFWRTPVRANRALRNVSTVPTDSTEALLQYADDLLAQKRYPEAKAIYRKVLAQDPQSARALEGVGLAAASEGDKLEAFVHLDVASQLNPRLPKAQYALAQLYLDEGFHREALQAIQVAVEEAPIDARAWNLLGLMLSNTEPQRSEEAYQRAVALEPRNPYYLLDLAGIQASRLRTEEAETHFRRALALAPQDAGVLSRVGGFLASRPGEARRQEAEALLLKAIQQNPNDAEALYHLGRLALDRQNAKQAVAFLEKAVRLPTHGDLAAMFYMLSRAYARTGNRTRAQEALANSRKIWEEMATFFRVSEQVASNPKDAALRLKLARLYALRGENVKAISQYEGCLMLDPKNTQARSELEAFVRRLKARGQMPSMGLYRAMVAAAQRGGAIP